MSTVKLMTPRRKLTQKHLYITTWGASAAYSGALVASNFAYSLSTSIMVLAILAAISFISTVTLQRRWREAFHSLGGITAGIVGGGVLGGLVFLAEDYYPFVFVAAMGVAALTLTTSCIHGWRPGYNRLARSCLDWSAFYALVYTGTALLTGGLATHPAYQPLFGALLGIWATLVVIAALEGDGLA